MKKVLMIVYAWPPAGGPGVQRCLKFAKYLPQFGWEPVVLTVENPETSAEDPSLLAKIPSELKVYKTVMLEPFTAYKKLTGKKANEKLATGHLKSEGKKGFRERVASWIRLNLFVPDAKIGWWPYGCSKAKSIIEEETIDLIFSSGPPHTTHLIARRLAISKGLPWVADFRDPWVEIDYYHFAKRSAFSTWLDRKMEAACIRSASATTTVSEGLVALLSTKPNAPDSYLLPNGYDASDLPTGTEQVEGPLKIYYGGSLSPDRIPHALIEAMVSLQAPASDVSIELNLAGSSCEALDTLIDQYGLRTAFKHLGYLPHDQATAALVKADISLLAINRVPGNERIVTGKIFEYMGAGNPILGIGPIHGDAAKLLEDTGSGKMFDYEDSEGIANFLKLALKDFHVFKRSFQFDCERYSRKYVASQLADVFDITTTQD